MSTKKSFKKSLIATSVLAGLSGASNLHAVMIDESSLGDGDFAGSGCCSGAEIVNVPGITKLTGTISAFIDDNDHFEIQGLPGGIQTISLAFDSRNASLNNLDVSFFEDGSLIKTEFVPVGALAMFDYTTEGGFGGKLGLEIDAFYEGGGDVEYSIDLPAAPIPVPGAALLFASGLGALGAAKARRKAKRRT